MKHYIRIKIKTKKKSNTLLKLNKLKIEIINIIYEKDALVLDIYYNDLKKIKKHLVLEKLEIIDDIGIYKYKNILKQNMLFIVSILFAIILFLFLNNIIIKVNIIHENKDIREMLYDALKERGVTNLTFKKSYQEYETIIAEIKNEYQNELEWLEIDVDGMIINVRVEERIISEKEENNNTCHVVASNSGIITSIKTEKGVTNVAIGDYVNEGDILISGKITVNDEVKNNVCAGGEVYAEVWYKINVSIPLTTNVTNKTGKMRYNFSFKNGNKETKILKSRVNNSIDEKTKIFSIGSYTFYLIKEYETNNTNITYTIDEALTKAKELVYEKLETQGLKIDDIIYEKYLQKSVNNGNLDIELFVALNEQIGVLEYYKVENNDKEYNGDNTGIN